MDLYWLEQSEHDVPHHSRWLGSQELRQLRNLLFLKRRSDWRLGRWTAKCAIAVHRQLPLVPEVFSTIEICSSPSGAPDAFVANRPANVILSISHRAGSALCTLTDIPVRLGCDMEVVEPHGNAFLEDYFTFEERDFVARLPSGDRDCFIALLWSAKESALKAMREGLRLDTRSVVVRPEAQQKQGWSTLQAHSRQGDIFHGWWREENGLLRTLVSDCTSGLPVELQLPTLAQRSA
jgi:4'-phosphopantetheinyl transferase